MYSGGGMGYGGMYEDKGGESEMHIYDFDDTIAQVKTNIRVTITSPKGDYEKVLDVSSDKFPEVSKELETKFSMMDFDYDFSEFEKEIEDAIISSEVLNKLKSSVSNPSVQTTILTARTEGEPVINFFKKIGLDPYIIPLGSMVGGNRVTGQDKADWIEKRIDFKKTIKKVYFIDDSAENRKAVYTLRDNNPEIEFKIETPPPIKEMMGMMNKQEKAKHAKNMKRLSKDMAKINKGGKGNNYGGGGYKVPDYVKGTLTRKLYELSKQEKAIVDDIVFNDNSLEEININQISDKLKKYGKKGLLTLAIILSVAGQAPAQNTQDIIDQGIEYVSQDEKTDLYNAIMSVAMESIQEEDYNSEEELQTLRDIVGYYSYLRDGTKAPFNLSSEAQKLVDIYKENLAKDSSSLQYHINNGKNMNLEEKVSSSELDSIETYADSKLDPIDVEFTKHFFNRLNDPRNQEEISSEELISFFDRLSNNKKSFIDFLTAYKELVATDNRTNLNIPFVNQANKAIAKTVMRKRGFQTSNPKLSINEIIPGTLTDLRKEPGDIWQLFFSKKWAAIGPLGFRMSYRNKRHAEIWAKTGKDHLGNDEKELEQDLDVGWNEPDSINEFDDYEIKYWATHADLVKKLDAPDAEETYMRLRDKLKGDRLRALDYFYHTYFKEDSPEKLDEGPQFGVLYHYTDRPELSLNDNRLGYEGGDPISLTRSRDSDLKSWGMDALGNAHAILVLDKDKLRQNYKVTPYKDPNYDGYSGDEMEEQIQPPISNLDKYLIKVILQEPRKKWEDYLEAKGIPYEVENQKIQSTSSFSEDDLIKQIKNMDETRLFSKNWWKEQLVEVLTETKANTHLTHLEELILTQGQDGFNQAKNFLYELIKNLKGESNTIKNVSVKWDGAPAVFTGINPENGQFFVGTKSVFNKNPKINYTPKDIDENHGHAPGLAKKLKLALDYLPALGIKGILQGDFMFDNDEVETNNIEGVPHYTFKPNTIRYAVEANSELGKKVISARIGIIFHTTYNDLSGGGASFGANISGLRESTNVWFDDAYFKDSTGILLSDQEEKFVLQKINEADSINVDYINLPLKNLNIYINSEIKQGEFLNDPSKSFERFKNWYQQAIDKGIAKVKRPETKERKKLAGEEKLKEFESQKQDILNVFRISKLLSEAKSIFITKYDKAVATKHFIDNGDGTLGVTKAEGFVAVDHTENGIKLVDRLEFSRNNFNAGKPGS